MLLRIGFRLATAIALFAVLTGCDAINDEIDAESASPSASASPAEARERRLLTPAEAEAALPTVSDLGGTGWTAGPSSTDDAQPTVMPARCAPLVTAIATDFPAYKSKLAANESRTFTNETGSYTAATYEIASWTNAADSALPIDAAQVVDRCTSTLTVSLPDGTVQTFTPKRLPALPIGDKQVAMQFSASNHGVKFYLTIFEATIGHNLITVSQTTRSPDDLQKAFEPLIKGILADLAK
ncbi:hypothetical protein [Cryptosporangium phraense]|uniref:DUF5642 domain-containing protein n=1 Tax=Cryptosporangium phraense TaxID=2593070 RepID=A0A545ALS8_9ACTN|nr:hypothetical protein [Cryptosporangium phraense]TQS42262.1 hypothetical protein FL583_25340 [Cryptosporangium phraense]